MLIIPFTTDRAALTHIEWAVHPDSLVGLVVCGGYELEPLEFEVTIINP